MNKPTLTPDQYSAATDLVASVIRDAMEYHGKQPSPEQVKECAIAAASAFLAGVGVLNGAALPAVPVPPAAL